MRNRDYSPSAEFLAEFFGPTTEHAVELRSLPNERGAGPNRPLFGRDLPLVENHCARWDGVGRAMYFGVCTRLTGSFSGGRADVVECSALWAEVDTRKLGLDKEAVKTAVWALPCQPSIVIDSGGGLHFYWLLSEALDVRPAAAKAAETEDAIVAVLKQLAGIMAGDTSVCDLARIMRLPGTHNTKPEVMATNNGLPAPVTILVANWQCRHHFSDLVDWLDWQRPVVSVCPQPAQPGKGKAAFDDNPYLAAAARLGFKPPLDVEKALAAMTYLGHGDTGLHQTQLRVSASLVAQGVPDDEIVTLVMAATADAAGNHGRTWNWRREERALRAMIATAHTKFAKPVEKAVSVEQVAVNDREAEVVNLGAERLKRSHKASAGVEQTSDKIDLKASVKAKKLGKGDDELALNFASQHADTLRYVAKWDQWLRWDGVKWDIDETLFVQEAARETLRDIALAIASKPGEMSVSAGTVSAVEKLARSDRRHATRPDQLDSDPWLLNTPGGIVDLRTGLMSPCDPNKLCTKATAVGPAPVLHDECPIWLSFLAKVLKNDQKLIDYLQKVIGYSLTGVTIEQQLWFLHGDGRNGKGVFISAIAGIMGSYACIAGMEVFTASANDRHSTEIARFIGARMVSAQETDEGRHWAESRIKSLTGGDPITARFMCQDDFTFTPKFKLWFAGNHKPGLRNVDKAMVARVNMVPFLVYFSEEERDLNLPEKLKAEWPSILRWAIDGCLKWQREGLRRASAVVKATSDYIKAEDSLATWLAEATESEAVGENECELTTDLFAAWKAWAEAAGENPGSMKRFSQKMISRGFENFLHSRSRKSQFRKIRLVRSDYTDAQRYGG